MKIDYDLTLFLSNLFTKPSDVPLPYPTQFSLINAVHYHIFESVTYIKILIKEDIANDTQ